MTLPNPRYYRHVRITSDDFIKPDAWEFYSIVKNWPEFQAGSVQKTEDEKILKDVSLTSVILGPSASLKAVLIWHERGIKFENYEYWLSSNINIYDNVKHIMTIDSAIENTINDLLVLGKEVKDYIDGKSDMIELDDCIDCIEILDTLSSKTKMEKYKKSMLNLLNQWDELKEFDESYQIKTVLEELIHRIYG